MGRGPIGFTANFYVDTLDRAAWTADMDRAQELGATAIRAGMSPWEADEENVAHVEWCLQDAASRGIQVMIVTAQLANVQDQSVPVATLIDQACGFVEKLAPRIAPHVTWWQVLNEHDAGSWIDWSSLGTDWDEDTGRHRRPGMTDEYLGQIETILDRCRTAIHAANPACLVGTAVTGVMMDTGNEQYTWRPFYRIVQSVDYIGINGYPMVWDEKYYEMPARLRRTAHWAGKPVILTEIGLPSTDQSEAETMEWIAHQIDYATRSADVGGVFVYQLTDTGTDPNDAEQQFGIYRHDGTPKDGHRAVRAMIRSINGTI